MGTADWKWSSRRLLLGRFLEDLPGRIDNGLHLFLCFIHCLINLF